MRVSNLAARPFLNTRPVWLVVIAAAFVSLVLLAVNFQLYRASNRALSEQLALADELRQQRATLEGEVRQQLDHLQRVPWRTLSAQVEGINVVLREHGFSWLALLGDVERVMPYQVRLTRIGPSIEPDGVELSIEGVARTRDAMLEFFENLIADESFADTLPKAEMTPEEGDIGYTFSLTVDYHPSVPAPEDEDGDAAGLEEQGLDSAPEGEVGEAGPEQPEEVTP
jgi:Tfp pilus assembly protein PilN